MKAIDCLLLDERDESTKQILRKIKHINMDAFRQMMGENRTFGPKYHLLQRTSIWKIGKRLRIQYAIAKKQINCKFCNTRLNFTRCTLHHDKPYDSLELFTPTKCSLVHNGCHADFHRKKR